MKKLLLSGLCLASLAGSAQNVSAMEIRFNDVSWDDVKSYVSEIDPKEAAIYGAIGAGVLVGTYKAYSLIKRTCEYCKVRAVLKNVKRYLRSTKASRNTERDTVLAMILSGQDVDTLAYEIGTFFATNEYRAEYAVNVLDKLFNRLGYCQRQLRDAYSIAWSGQRKEIDRLLKGITRIMKSVSAVALKIKAGRTFRGEKKHQKREERRQFNDRMHEKELDVLAHGKVRLNVVNCR